MFRKSKAQGEARLPNQVRVYAIGDIHGRFDLFRKLMRQIEEDHASRGEALVRVIVLGDFIDRGPDSAALAKSLQTIAATSPNFIVLKGNHEAAMVDGLDGDERAFQLWLENGGDAALASWGVPDWMIASQDFHELAFFARKVIPPEVLDWMRNLEISHRCGDYFFVHAGVRPGIPLAKQDMYDMLWIRDQFLQCEEWHGAMIVHGHSIDEAGPQLMRNRIGVDTGAYRTGMLTAIGLERDQHWVLGT